jgi:hypothetical protein
MSMMCTVWHNDVYKTMAGIDGTGSGWVAGSGEVQMVAFRKTTSFMFGILLSNIHNKY